MEIIVDHVIISLFADEEFNNLCKCEQCINDIKAVALNSLKPHYIANNSGLIYTKIQELRRQAEVDATAALIKGATIVHDNPRHKQ